MVRYSVAGIAASEKAGLMVGELRVKVLCNLLCCCFQAESTLQSLLGDFRSRKATAATHDETPSPRFTALHGKNRSGHMKLLVSLFASFVCAGSSASQHSRILGTGFRLSASSPSWPLENHRPENRQTAHPPRRAQQL